MGGKLDHQGERIHIYPDVTTEQQKQQAQFKDIGTLLRSANLRHGIIPPANLLTTYKDKTHSFTTAAEATDFYSPQVKPSVNTAIVPINEARFPFVPTNKIQPEVITFCHGQSDGTLTSP